MGVYGLPLTQVGHWYQYHGTEVLFPVLNGTFSVLNGTFSVLNVTFSVLNGIQVGQLGRGGQLGQGGSLLRGSKNGVFLVLKLRVSISSKVDCDSLVSSKMEKPW